MPIPNETTIRSIVRTAVEAFSIGFKGRHIAEVDDPDGVINMKIHNIFISALGPEIQYYSAVIRSLDSSLGSMLESLAINIAKLNFTVHKNVAGPLYAEQTGLIAEILEKYKRRILTPSVKDYQGLRKLVSTNNNIKRHDSDYYLIDNANRVHYLIELKIGGDLDNKKARSEKEAILEQYAILSNTLLPGETIKIFFATGYNRYGEGRVWKQERVRQFFADDELLIGKLFWNFICKSDQGYDVVIDEYKNNAGILKLALEEIKDIYLGDD